MKLSMEIITDITQLEKYLGRVIYIETDENPRCNGFRYVYNQPMIHLTHITRGFRMACDTLSGVGGTGDHAVTDWTLEKGEVRIRLATEVEIKNVQISYDAYNKGM